MLKRSLNLPKNNHFFLFGPRQTGKTSLIRDAFGDSVLHEIDLLKNSEYTRYVVDPSKIRGELLALPSHKTHIFIDEIQKIPELLDEVHSLIEAKIPQKFILSGSSARKLKRNNANMLGGRALNLNLYPFTEAELADF